MEGGPLLWILPLYLQVDQKSDDDVMMKERTFLVPILGQNMKAGISFSLHDSIRPIFLVFHFSFSLNLAVH